MTDETISNVAFDKDFWPDAKESEISLKVELSDLWNTHEDALSRLVAESLLNEPPHGGVDLYTDPITYEIFLWSIGGDTLVLKESLAKEIIIAGRTFVVRSQAQAEEVEACIKRLGAVETAIKDVIAHGQYLLYKYDKSRPPVNDKQQSDG